MSICLQRQIYLVINFKNSCNNRVRIKFYCETCQHSNAIYLNRPSNFINNWEADHKNFKKNL